MVVITAENLSKQYRLGKTHTDLLSERLGAGIKSLFGRSRGLGMKEGTEGVSHIWALKNINFKVRQGEVLGIIGRNGAGKSTLLKILSRITEPTEGRVEMRGRVGSLLEVGTGFHPELTGRENVFLNGAILGMAKAEIHDKFDEIISFSGVEKFIDTPVKRYSSGMQVRLAFAVAAHLEPEILLIDEVLAVGDLAFQRKCLGKMGEVARAGRTVLFVSHNMSSVLKFCQSCLFLDAGKLVFSGSTREAVDNYLGSLQDEEAEHDILNLAREGGYGRLIRFSKCNLLDSDGRTTNSLLFGEPFSIHLEAVSESRIEDISLIVRIESFDGEPITEPASEDAGDLFTISESEPLSVVVDFVKLCLTPGKYWITVSTMAGRVLLDQVVKAVSFEISQSTFAETKPHSGTWGHVHTVPNWNDLGPGKREP
ncbi:MAG: ABC transporter ATP-binding protein [bacterium]